MKYGLAASFVVFCFGVVSGASSIWSLLAVMPEIAPSVDPDVSIPPFVFQVVLLGLSAVMILESRHIALTSWSIHRQGMQSSPTLVEIDKWFYGSGPITGFASALAPALAAALLLVSPWMALVFLGVVYGSVKGLIESSRARAAYNQMHSSGRTVRIRDVDLRKAVLAGVTAVSIALMSGQMMGEAMDSVRSIGEYVKSSTDRAIGGTKVSAALFRKLLNERIELQRQYLREANRGQTQGVTSLAEVLEARLALNATESKLATFEGDFARQIMTLEKQRIEAMKRVQSLRSIAPALR